MRKVCKRTAALLLVVCLLLPMIPAAFAAALSSSVTQYNLGCRNFTNDTGAYVTGKLEGAATNPESAIPLRKNASYLNNSGCVKAELAEYNLTVSFDATSAEAGHWYSIQLSSVKAGTYDMTFYNSTGGDYGLSKIYIVTKSAYDVVLAPYLEALQAGEALTKQDNDDIFEALYDANAVLNAGNEGYYSNQKINWVKYQSIGAVTFPAKADYVMMIRSAGASPEAATHYKSNVYNMDMTLIANEAIAGVYTGTALPSFYADAAEAATAAANNTMVLFGNASVDALTVTDGMTLDLNGNNLTANSVMIVNGGSVIDSGETAGVLTADLSASGNNGGYLPLKNSEGAYSFYKAAVNVTEAESGQLKFQVKFDKNAGYDALAVENSGAAIGGDFAWTVGDEEKTASHDINYADDVTLAQKWGAEVKKNSYNNGWIVLNFKGLDAFEALSVAPYIVSEGVTIQAAAQTLK